MTTANVLQELEWRGFVQQATPGLAAHVAKGPVTAYCGFDPTAPSCSDGAVGSKPQYAVTGPLATCAARPGVACWTNPRHSNSCNTLAVVMAANLSPC